MSDRMLLHKSAQKWETYWRHIEPIDYINYTPQLLSALRQHVKLLGARVLEVGCGTGGNASELARLGAIVTALDFAPTALRRTGITASKTGVHVSLVQANAYQLPFASGAFDVVYHQGFLEHFTEPEVLLQEQRRVLRNGGYLLVDVPQRYNWYTIHKHRLIRLGRWPYGGWETEFGFGELVKLLQSNGFRFVAAYGRGYYPRPLEMIRNLSKIEKKWFKRDGPPSRFWQKYDTAWRWFEQTWLGCNILQCVGVLTQAVS